MFAMVAQHGCEDVGNFHDFVAAVAVVVCVVFGPTIFFFFGCMRVVRYVGNFHDFVAAVAVVCVVF